MRSCTAARRRGHVGSVCAKSWSPACPHSAPRWRAACRHRGRVQERGVAALHRGQRRATGRAQRTQSEGSEAAGVCPACTDARARRSAIRGRRTCIAPRLRVGTCPATRRGHRRSHKSFRFRSTPTSIFDVRHRAFAARLEPPTFAGARDQIPRIDRPRCAPARQGVVRVAQDMRWRLVGRRGRFSSIFDPTPVFGHSG